MDDQTRADIMASSNVYSGAIPAPKPKERNKVTHLRRVAAYLFDKASTLYLRTLGWSQVETKDGARWSKPVTPTFSVTTEKAGALVRELQNDVGSGLPPKQVRHDTRKFLKGVKRGP